ncbi:hypothetical protein C943_04587 [Mariniradius saccharolyticus AK6]|uniref:Uncharacterized protein n=1 Tax=Mariniradius saccharolyticus AK6 TaxID=1239962 RepID=M7XGN1_9BACT|nr:hypothetical protein C943_04587 [Mariniradius saccharolyticus AK6]
MRKSREWQAGRSILPVSRIAYLPSFSPLVLEVNRFLGNLGDKNDEF